ncbi:hypothetical protein Syun_009702 [Stephania yunnanensis]|uniref:Cytochrome b561 domain-containing protein n=1 Tax=Stephania yunnanensis TaxID=152371 RepID=A0AAP0KF05_9MAGN
MTGTRALIAFSDPNSGQLVVLTYILDPTVKLQRSPLLSRPLDIHLISSSAALYGGRMASIHDGASVEIFASFKLVPNRTKVNLASLCAAASGDNRIKTMKAIHGVLNALSWGFLLPVEALMARYFRHMQAVGVMWFYAHAGIQLSAFVLGAARFGIGVQLGKMSPGVVYGLHGKLGIAAFSLGSLQTLALFFRPKTTNEFRKYWKSYHHFVGSYWKLAYCLAVSSVVGASIALEVNSWVMFCRKAKEKKMRREGIVSTYEKGSSTGSHH